MKRLRVLTLLSLAAGMALAFGCADGYAASGAPPARVGAVSAGGRHTCGVKYCNPEFDKLFKAQSETFDFGKRVEITHKMERILLQDLRDDHGYYWMATMSYWNRLQKWPPPVSGTMVFTFGKFEQVWCQRGKCM